MIYVIMAALFMRYQWWFWDEQWLLIFLPMHCLLGMLAYPARRGVGKRDYT